jgi:hypothetical protein
MTLYIINFFFFLQNHPASSEQVLDIYYPWVSIVPVLAVSSFQVTPSPGDSSA